MSDTIIKYTPGKLQFDYDDVQAIYERYIIKTGITTKLPLRWKNNIAQLELAMWDFGYKNYRYHDYDLMSGTVTFIDTEARNIQAYLDDAPKGIDTIIIAERDRDIHTGEVTNEKVDVFINTNVKEKAEPAQFPKSDPVNRPTHTDLMVSPENIPEQELPKDGFRLPRKVIVSINRKIILELFLKTCEEEPILKEAKLIDVHYDFNNDSFYFKFEHNSFAEVPDGDCIPRYIPMRKMDG